MKFVFYLKQLFNKLSVRASAFALFSVFIALASVKLAPYVSSELATMLGSDSLEVILKIIASSMLSVVIFSLTIVIAAYTSASKGVTPKAARLLIEHNQSQNTLSIFLGHLSLVSYPSLPYQQVIMVNRVDLFYI